MLFNQSQGKKRLQLILVVFWLCCIVVLLSIVVFWHCCFLALLLLNLKRLQLILVAFWLCCIVVLLFLALLLLDDFPHPQVVLRSILTMFLAWLGGSFFFCFFLRFLSSASQLTIVTGVSVGQRRIWWIDRVVGGGDL
jgi:hypothetical protein